MQSSVQILHSGWIKMEVPQDLIEQLVDEWEIIQCREYDYDRIDCAVRNLDSIIGSLQDILKSQSTEQEKVQVERYNYGRRKFNK